MEKSSIQAKSFRKKAHFEKFKTDLKEVISNHFDAELKAREMKISYLEEDLRRASEVNTSL